MSHPSESIYVLQIWKVSFEAAPYSSPLLILRPSWDKRLKSRPWERVWSSLMGEPLIYNTSMDLGKYGTGRETCSWHAVEKSFDTAVRTY